MDALVKLLEVIAKYAWAVAVLAGFMLFLPDDAAKQIGILELRAPLKGLLWIGLVLALAMWCVAIFQYVDRRLLDGWLRNRRELKTRAKEELEARELAAKQELKDQESLAFRLKGLDQREMMWIAYCLFYKVQSLTAAGSDATAHSLCYKRILVQGSGHLLNLPFHFPDHVWKYLLEHESEFLEDEWRNDSRFQSDLATFRASLFVV